MVEENRELRMPGGYHYIYTLLCHYLFIYFPLRCCLALWRAWFLITCLSLFLVLIKRMRILPQGPERRTTLSPNGGQIPLSPSLHPVPPSSCSDFFPCLLLLSIANSQAPYLLHSLPLLSSALHVTNKICFHYGSFTHSTVGQPSVHTSAYSVCMYSSQPHYSVSGLCKIWKVRSQF